MYDIDSPISQPVSARPVASARRRAAAALALACTGVLLVGVRPASAQTRAQTGEGPNVLVILTDDQRADMMEVMPRTRKWFDRRGVRFPNGYVTTPLCCPSRASIFTGQYTHNHGVRSNAEATTLDQGETVQQALNAAGYRTGIVGKYLNGWPLEAAPPHFDRFATFNGGYFDRTFNVSGRVKSMPGYSTDVIRRRAVRFVRRGERVDGRPWLLFVTPAAPHAPFNASPRFDHAAVPQWSPNPAVLEERRGEVDDKPEWIRRRNRTAEHARDARRERQQMLMSVDVLVGTLMREMGQLGERRDTLAFFLSDNGYMEAEHGMFGKSVPYEQAVRVPFYARWPGVLNGGTNDTRRVANIDIVPTVYEAAGRTGAGDVDGYSILGTHARDHAFMESLRGPGPLDVPPWAAIRTDSVKYVEYYGEGGSIIYREYYDLANDPWELLNLLGDADPGNDPSPSELTMLALRLQQDSECEGTDGPLGCP